MSKIDNTTEIGIRALDETEIEQVSGGGTMQCYDGKTMVTANMWLGDKVMVISATSDWHSAKILNGRA